jgi:hypothetical protein
VWLKCTAIYFSNNRKASDWLVSLVKWPIANSISDPGQIYKSEYMESGSSVSVIKVYGNLFQ